MVKISVRDAFQKHVLGPELTSLTGLRDLLPKLSFSYSKRNTWQADHRYEKSDIVISGN